MNYIKHLAAFIQKVRSDDRLNPNHISLYLSLFHYWNQNMFENPVSVSRIQVLTICKIGSQHTYYKCLKDLHKFGYLTYFPSHDSSKGCLVTLCNFDISPNIVEEVTCAEMHNHMCKNGITACAELQNRSCKNDIAAAAKMQPSINNKNIKTYCDEKTQIQNLESVPMGSETETKYADEKSQKKKVPGKKEITKVFGRVPPNLDEVKTFFKLEVFPELEAHKFFNHFQSNGWKVGGKSPMKDWNAAARNWMLNYQKFNPGKPAGPGSRNLNQNNTKNYGEPL